MRTILFAATALMVLASPALAMPDVVKCSYTISANPKIAKDRDLSSTFVQARSEAGDWLYRMRTDKSLGGGRASTQECHDMDDSRPSWTLYTLTEGGTVSLLHGQTEAVCERVLYQLQHQHDCGGTGVCSWMVMPGDYKSGECFQ